MTEQSPASTTPTRSPWMAAAVTIAFAVLFLLLRTQQFNAVDGALRCLAVFHNPATPLHGNNHMLHPFWIRVWTGAFASVGLAARDWFAFIRLSQAMNAICAAVAIGLLFDIIETVAGTRFALLGSVQFGLCTAVMLHATNSAEPVTGLLFSIAALWVLVVALRRSSTVGFLLVGLLLTLAMASYESMALTAVLAAFGCIFWPGTTVRQAIQRLLTVGASGLISVIVVYGLGYASLGVPTRRMVAQFFVLADDQYYGGFSISKLVNLPFGVLRNLFQGVPDDYRGIRYLLHGPHGKLWMTMDLLAVLLLVTLTWPVWKGLKAAVRRSSQPKALVWLGIAVAMLAAYFPVLYRAPLYDKMWLLPLAATAILVGVAYRFGDAGVQRWLTVGLIAIVLVEAGRNIPRAVEDHVQETAYLGDAQAIASVLSDPKASVVYDFDPVSQLWVTIWGYGVNTLSLPASTRKEAEDWLAQAQAKESAENGSIYFIAVLDHNRAAWDAFLGQIMKIPYSDFECYREKSVVVQRYSLDGDALSVRRLQAPFSCGTVVASSQKLR